jgi:CHAD domain-containing protein
MADTKWISGLQGDMPLGEAARRILTVRLGHVMERLAPAVERPEEDIEHVHQLRVGSRRAAAAVRIFEQHLLPRLARRARRTLRDIRRAAGAARDWDVFLETVKSRRADAKHRPGYDFLLGLGQGARLCAQDKLREATENKAEKLQRLIAEMRDAPLLSSDAGTLRELAVPMLTQLTHEFEQAAGGNLQDYDAQHQVRILGKQLRYAMELFESCFPPSFRERGYPPVSDMQEILGLANDSHVAAAQLDDLSRLMMKVHPAPWKRYRLAVEQLRHHHERRLPRQRGLFLKWWASWKKSGGLREWL